MFYNSIVINQVLVVFIIIAIGVYARKRNIINDQVRSGISELILNIAMPLMIITSFNQEFSWDMLVNSGILLVFSFAIHIGSYIISKFLYYKYPDNIRSVMRYATVFSNGAFMGYPVIEALYGKVGVFYASIYNIPFRVFMWSIGIALFTKDKGKDNMKKMLLNPSIIAVCIGFLLFLTPFKLPLMINKTFEMVGSITTPLSMIVIGTLLADINFKDIFSGFAVFYTSFIRLLALPLITLFILKAAGLNKILLDTLVLLTGMTAVSMMAILAEKYKANAPFASKCVFVSTVLSIITIPVLVMLL